MAVTTAYVLAAGLGTRLRPLTSERPKPLVEVCGTPLIHFALRLLADAGITRVGINSHWLHPQIPQALGAQFEGMELQYTHEPAVLGTGGGLRGLARRVPAPAGEKVLVLNADALIDLDTRALVASGAGTDVLATLVLKSTPDTAAYGAIGTDGMERITAFAGRIDPIGPVVRERMFCGVHLVDPRAFDVLPAVDVDAAGTATGPQSGINDEGYPHWLREGALLRGFDTTGTFCDVGTPERLLEANLAVLAGVWSSTHLRPFTRFEERSPGVYVSPRARVAASAQLHAPVVIDDDAVVDGGANVGFAVIGKRCHVGPNARVAAAALQSDATVDDVVIDAIVSAHSRMKVAPHVAAQIKESFDLMGR